MGFHVSLGECKCSMKLHVRLGEGSLLVLEGELWDLDPYHDPCVIPLNSCCICLGFRVRTCNPKLWTLKPIIF